VAGGVRLLKGPPILSAREADALRQLATLVERIVNPPKGNVVAFRRTARRPRSLCAGTNEGCSLELAQSTQLFCRLFESSRPWNLYLAPCL
jgi:hypothetical protein